MFIIITKLVILFFEKVTDRKLPGSDPSVGSVRNGDLQIGGNNSLSPSRDNLKKCKHKRQGT